MFLFEENMDTGCALQSANNRRTVRSVDRRANGPSGDDRRVRPVHRWLAHYPSKPLHIGSVGCYALEIPILYILSRCATRHVPHPSLPGQAKFHSSRSSSQPAVMGEQETSEMRKDRRRRVVTMAAKEKGSG